MFFLFTYTLTLYVDQMLNRMKKKNEVGTKNKLDKVLMLFLFGFVAAAFISSISLLYDMLYDFNDPILKRLIPIGVALILFRLGTLLLKSKMFPLFK